MHAMRFWLFLIALAAFLINDAKAESEKVFYVGDTVKLADSEWTVLAAKNMGSVLPGDMDEKHTTGRFVAVQFSVKNTTSDVLEIVGEPILIAANGQKFKELGDIEFYLPDGANNALQAKIKPGTTKKFIEIYDVPKDVTGLSFQVHTLGAKPDSFALVGIGL
jgi:uncharacterized protein DUF4352